MSKGLADQGAPATRHTGITESVAMVFSKPPRSVRGRM